MSAARKPYTQEDQDKIKELRAKRKNYAQIAAALGRSIYGITSAVRDMIKAEKLARYDFVPSWTDEDIKTLIEMRTDGKSSVEIAVKLGRTLGSVNFRIFEMIQRGELGHVNPRLQPDDLEAIHTLLGQGMSTRKVADKIGCSKSVVGKLRQRRAQQEPSLQVGA
jgi:DNA-binding CsgD family transcriptional regulator